MKFEIVQKNFAASLAFVKGLSGGDDPLNPYRSVRIADGGDRQISITATNGEQQVEVMVCAYVQEGGRICVPGGSLSRFVGALGGVVKVEHVAKAPRAIVCSGETVFSVAVGSVDDFPEMHRPGFDAKSFHIYSLTLCEMLRKVHYAASRAKGRVCLGGVNFAASDTEDGSLLEVTACDGRRLSTVSHGVDRVEGGVSFTVPMSTVKILREISSDDSTVLVETDGHTAYFRGGSWCVKTRLLEDAYPNWRGVIPQNDGVCAKVDRALFASEIAKAALAAAKDGPNYGVTLVFSDGSVRLSAKSEFSSAESSMKCAYAGDMKTVRVDASLMGDVLGCIDMDEVSVSLHDGAALVVTCEIPFIGVVMPLK